MRFKALKKFDLEKRKKLVKNLASPGKSLREKIVKGGFWVFSLRIVTHVFGLARTIVLARLLSPGDFGLFGIALLSLAVLDTFLQTGFRQALIQKKEKTKPYLNTAWTVGIIRALVITIILFFVAPLAASFFKAPAAELILKVIGAAVVIQSLTNIAVIYFEKELQFHKYFTYQFLGTVADVVVAIATAFLLRSVWALVFGCLAGNLVRCIVSYLIDPYRPKFQLEKTQAKELFGFGKWVLGGSILIFLITQGDDILIGKMLGIVVLGFYRMAYRISNMPTTEITHVISQVAFPAYSKLQDNIPKLREAYLKVLQITAFLSFPVGGLIFVLAPDFTKIFLGEKWTPIIPAMQVLALAGLIRSIAATTGFIFYAVGKPKIDTSWQLVRLFVLAGLIYPFTMKWRLLGTSIVVFLSIFVSNIGFCFSVIKITKCSVRNFVNTMLSPLVSSTIAALVVLGLRSIIGIGTGMWRFIIFSCMGALTYLIMIYLSSKPFNYEIQRIIKESI